MPAARYWRAVGLSAVASSLLELSAFHLYAGGGDPDYENVSLLLHCNGANGATTITDNSADPKTVTPVGTASISTAQKKFGGASLRIDGTGARCTIPHHPSLDMPTGDFTIEMFICPTVLGGSSICLIKATGTGLNPFEIGTTTRNKFKAGFCSSSAGYLLTGTTTFVTGTFYRVAFLRQGNVFSLVVDGLVEAQQTQPIALYSNSADPVSIGAAANGAYPFTGYIDELRITVGVVRDMSTVPDAEFPETTLMMPVRVDTSATLTSSVAPVAGSLAHLQDSDTVSVVVFDPGPPGFAIQWDFGAGGTQNIAAAAVGSATLPDRFLSHFTLQYSTDGKAWATSRIFGKYPWPGANQMVPVDATFDPFPVVALGQQGAGRLVWSDVGSLVVRRVDGSLVYLDAEAGGAGRVRNTVKEKGAPNLPVRRRVRLVRERDGMVVREQWSDPATGAYDFQFVDERQTYTVLSYDHTLDFRAVIADGLTLANGTVELMP